MERVTVKRDGNNTQNYPKDSSLNYFLFQSQYPLLFTTLNDDPK
jgi:hypothetical protein